jgi:hypothetical protein
MKIKRERNKERERIEKEREKKQRKREKSTDLSYLIDKIKKKLQVSTLP